MFEQKYLIMEIIGKNSQKMTSIVKDKTNKYYIAKKIPLDDERSIHEISMMRNLSHPNIIALHQLIYQQKFAYLIEQYCEEGDLEFHLKRQIKIKGFIPEEVVARWMLQILLAVQYLHHNKIIHRDIRPRNIFLTANGNIKLGSFKVSKVLEAETNYAQTFLNSPYYMTPQLMEGKAYECKVDIWAFGCVLFQVCSLKPSFASLNLVDLLNKLSKGKFDDLPSNYSKQLNMIYQKCMRKNPNERANAKQLLKTNYFLQVIQKFIKDKGLNINMDQKIPIKKYNIHRSKYERLKIKKGLISKQMKVQPDKKETLLPKLQIQTNKIQRKAVIHSKSKDKKEIVQTPVIKRNGQSKDRYEKAISTQKKKIKTETGRKKSERTEKTDISFDEEKKESRVIEKQKKLMMAPPMLPKPRKSQKNCIQGDRLPAVKAPEIDKNQNFEMTMSKEDLSRELSNFQKKVLPQINEGLNKILQSLNIRQQDQQIEFQFVQDNELRLTNKSKNEQQMLVQTCQSKLQQLIQQINYKYCPDMQPIAQKTTQFDSSQFSKLKFSLHS